MPYSISLIDGYWDEISIGDPIESSDLPGITLYITEIGDKSHGGLFVAAPKGWIRMKHGEPFLQEKIINGQLSFFLPKEKFESLYAKYGR